MLLMLMLRGYNRYSVYNSLQDLPISSSNPSLLTDLRKFQVKFLLMVGLWTVLTSEYRRVSGFVPQEDALFPFLTVQETLTYSALLRLKTKRKEAAAKVKRLIQELGLEHVADSRIGEGSRSGISGGERRRVSIGVELVHDPNVILIDEPTSGLDSASALQVVMLLKDMTVKQGKTIILMIHQPGFRILELINRIVLLSNGGGCSKRISS